MQATMEPTGLTEEQTSKVIASLGEVINFLESEIKCPKIAGESIADYVRRAFFGLTRTETEEGSRQVIQIGEHGALMLLANRAKKEGLSGFGNVTSDERKGDNHFAFRRDGRTDQFTVTRNYKQIRNFTFQKRPLEDRLGELMTSLKSVKDAIDKDSRALEMNRAAFERKFESERDQDNEALIIQQQESKIRLLKAEVEPLEIEIENVKGQLETVKSMVARNYATKYEIPTKAELKVTIEWPLPSTDA